MRRDQGWANPSYLGSKKPRVWWGHPNQLYFRDFFTSLKIITSICRFTRTPLVGRHSFSFLARVFHFFLINHQTNQFTPPKTNMTLEEQPFEDVSPIENDGFPMPRWFSGGHTVLLAFDVPNQLRKNTILWGSLRRAGTLPGRVPWLQLLYWKTPFWLSQVVPKTYPPEKSWHTCFVLYR